MDCRIGSFLGDVVEKAGNIVFDFACIAICNIEIRHPLDRDARRGDGTG